MKYTREQLLNLWMDWNNITGSKARERFSKRCQLPDWTLERMLQERKVIP